MNQKIQQRQRPDREARIEHKIKLAAAHKDLRLRKQQQGLIAEPPKNSSPYTNSLCQWKTTEEEQEAREEAVSAQLGLLRNTLPVLLRRFSEIEDLRNPRKIKYKLTIIYLTYMFCVSP
ncbi:hypothetical protein TI05_02775 [Achromatium sp. WMS3]|nr:hypothetical protein TI05_02775 [Achromatium sp. WMS3]